MRIHQLIALTFLISIIAIPALAQDDADAKFQAMVQKALDEGQSGESTRQLLWPDGAPGQKGDEDHDKPTIDWYLPSKEKATGAAVVVLPGGGYGGLAIGHEGKEVGEFFAKHGVAAFVVRYRLGSKGYRHPIMMWDAQRAIRYVRYHAKHFGVDADRIGIMGFSAGGHLCSTVATKFDAGDAKAADPMDRVSCRPDFAILCYPVISFSTKYGHTGSKINLLGRNPDPALVEDLSTEKTVTKDTPPVFIFQTDEDKGVPAENAVFFYLACREQGVPAEMHIYRTGRHGVGLAPSDPLLSGWPQLLMQWMKGLDLLKKS